MNSASPVPSKTDFSSALPSCSSLAALSSSCSAKMILATEQPNEITTKTTAMSNAFSAMPAAIKSTTSGKTREATCVNAQRADQRLSPGGLDCGSADKRADGVSVAMTVATKNGTLQTRSQSEPVCRSRVACKYRYGNSPLR